MQLQEHGFCCLFWRNLDFCIPSDMDIGASLTFPVEE